LLLCRFYIRIFCLLLIWNGFCIGIFCSLLIWYKTNSFKLLSSLTILTTWFNPTGRQIWRFLVITDCFKAKWKETKKTYRFETWPRAYTRFRGSPVSLFHSFIHSFIHSFFLSLFLSVSLVETLYSHTENLVQYLFEPFILIVVTNFMVYVAVFICSLLRHWSCSLSLCCWWASTTLATSFNIGLTLTVTALYINLLQRWRCKI
jgi:hypothetical protein